ncbi:metal ABC transporter solute-binding protein, Zn/Mn family [Streptomyces aureoversilis]|uniref:Metal ABC transporter solute-binding protein, Zn/Mn family n=1 Tax=Streptomyces aureoversilis TaxID=67277 RepID=A0ABV9ZZZ6_9ACTN
MRVSALPLPMALVAALALSLSGCDGASAPGTGGTERGGAPASAVAAVPVVASTNVYGDIVRQVGGDKVDVVSLISDPAQDPHSYEAGTRNQLALSRARVVVENGGGYDDFVGRMLRAADNPSADVINAVRVSGRTPPAGGEINEHVWYDLPTVGRLAARIADSLAKAAPGDGDLFRRNAQAFQGRLKALEAEETRIRSAHAGAAVAVTEPVPLYLIEACGLRDRTPPDFAEAVEEGTEVSPGSMRQMLDLFSGKTVEALVYNQQTSGPQTEKVRQAAKDNGIPVVPVNETLPPGRDYVGWMKSTIEELGKALNA